MEKLLIIGDSFAADWALKSPICGWPNRLSRHYQTTNLAQAGCGQYKIYRQLHSVDFMDFDHVLIWHTSPYRIHVQDNPVHQADLFHHNTDLVYCDIEHHAKTDPSLHPLLDWFNLYFDLEHADFVYSLIIDRMLQDLADYKGQVIHCVCQQSVYKRLEQQTHFLNFLHLFSPGSHGLKANHFDQKANDLVCQTILEILQK